MKQKVISVVGPTAVGKSKLGVELAKQFGGEIINGDSMQIYQEFDIGTAKVSKEEQDGIIHHLLDFKSPQEGYSAAEFQTDVSREITFVSKNNKLPIIVGGTGFYIHAALYGFNFSEAKRDERYVNEMLKSIDEIGVEPYFERLKKIDPVQANKMDPQNIRRVIRALEVYDTTGKTMSDYQQEQIAEAPYNSFIIGLDMDRELLYERINSRVDEMLEAGLEQEVKHLYYVYGEDIQAMQGIGYKEFIPYLKGENSLEEVAASIKQNTRRFAKRQLTYYRNKLPHVNWYTVHPSTYEESFTTIFQDVAGFLQTGKE
ncbi:tRNA (adenosine(37)-N6)-dimethylallyltransferase MiaA [Halalkalibacillus halophilus]|uniref:tRNA (adenosine(37)-N6)-dimethylallyltransferase MiaA n=1 Tax=Halalkalibacillus halophilus TaxID=392827 RepID=UPI0003F94448|nr:tRNA (adenosine(37)-N6)-dimethylallyltransferase MiaA [Halalkalibacillus halophilus]